jgi:hypothetical protein
VWGGRKWRGRQLAVHDVYICLARLACRATWRARPRLKTCMLTGTAFVVWWLTFML